MPFENPRARSYRWVFVGRVHKGSHLVSVALLSGVTHAPRISQEIAESISSRSKRELGVGGEAFCTFLKTKTLIDSCVGLCIALATTFYYFFFKKQFLCDLQEKFQRNKYLKIYFVVGLRNNYTNL